MKLIEKRKEAIEGNILFIEKIINIYKNYKYEIESVCGLYGYDEKLHSKSKILIWQNNIHSLKLNFLSNIKKNINYLDDFYIKIKDQEKKENINKILIYKNELEKFKKDIEESIKNDKNINYFDLASFNSIDLLNLLKKIKKLDNNCLKMQFILSQIAFKYDELFSYKIFFIFNDFPKKYMEYFYSLINPSKHSIFEPYLSEYMYIIDLTDEELINLDIDYLKGNF